MERCATKRDAEERKGTESPPLARDRPWPRAIAVSELNLLGQAEGVVDLDPEVADRRFDLGVTEQQLNRP